MNNFVNSSTSVSDNDLFNIQHNTVSGVGLNSEPEVDATNNDDLLNLINSANDKFISVQEEERIKKEEAEEEARKQLEESRLAEINKERSEQEALEREKKRQEENGQEIIINNPTVKKSESVEINKLNEEPDPTLIDPTLSSTEITTSEEEIEPPNIEESISNDLDNLGSDIDTITIEENIDSNEIEEISKVNEEIEEPIVNEESEINSEKSQNAKQEVPEAISKDKEIIPEKHNKITEIKKKTTNSPVKKKNNNPKTKKKTESKKSFNIVSLFNSKKKIDKETASHDWEYLATHDSLTGLLNNTALDRDIKKASLKSTIIFFDINNLKYTNDNFSHEAGNKLITAVSNSVSSFFKNETYRIGGDEFLVITSKDEHYIKTAINYINNEMATLTKASDNNLIYAVSSGYAIGDGHTSLEEIKNLADERMYKNKQAYKKAHKDLDMRGEFKEETEKKPERSYDDGLSKKQRELKNIIKTEHIVVTEETIERTIATINQKADDIRLIFLASADFNDLFIFQDVDEFIEIVASMDGSMDYSYIYAMHSGGALYYGTDEYYHEITELFQNVSNQILSGNCSPKSIQKMKGINIFQHIYIL